MNTYKLKTNSQGQVYAVEKSDGWFIPFDPDNTDYQKYLEWIAEGKTPEPAQEN